jgi:DUF4097 and DUF4098 domain-containing protein YvlB
MLRRNLLTAATALAFASSLALAHARTITNSHDDRAAHAQRHARDLNETPDNDDESDYKERDSSRQAYTLAPGAKVEINSVSGGVTVETSDASQAEVEIVRTARTREDLNCRQFKVESSADGLRIDGSDQREQCRHVQVHQTVSMRLPRRVDFSANSVAGNVRVGAIDGAVSLRSVAGRATVAQASGEATFSSIAGNVEVNLSRLGGGGVRMNSIAGNIDVGLPAGANANFTVSSITGEVIADTSDVTVNKVGHDSFEGRVGAGGTEMTFRSIAGNVRFHRTGE